MTKSGLRPDFVYPVPLCAILRGLKSIPNNQFTPSEPLLSFLLNILKSAFKLHSQDNSSSITARKIYASIKSIEAFSAKLVVWSIALIGGSFLAIFDSSYAHPKHCDYKLSYFIFIPGWSLIAISIYYGLKVSGTPGAADLHLDDLKMLTNIWEKADLSLNRQLRFFRFGLLVFGLWLILYLTWWVFQNG